MAQVEAWPLPCPDVRPGEDFSTSTLHLPCGRASPLDPDRGSSRGFQLPHPHPNRSEEHTSELQSRLHLVCRLLLEKKKNIHTRPTAYEPCTATTAVCPEPRGV